MRVHLPFLLLLLLPLLTTSTSCPMKSTYIPASSMSSFVNQYVDAVTPDNSLVDLITNPTPQNALAYSKTIMPIVIPIFAFAVIATIFMIVACVQICCVGCCASEKCRCTSYTYSSIKVLIGFIILFLVLLIAGSIAGMIFNHDTLAATSNTQCIAAETFNTIINGNNSTTWDGLANLTNLAQNMSSSFANNIDPIMTYISNATVTTLFNSLTQNTNGNLYNNVYTNTQCNTTISPTTVQCPNPDNSGCTSTLLNNFCTTTGSNMGAANITTEFQATTQVYASNLVNLNTELTNMYNTKATIIPNLDNLTQQTQQLSTDSQNYESTFQGITGTINYGLYITEIAIYVAYSFLILCSFCSILILTFIFCCRCFKLTGCVQFSWIFYWLMTTIILIISGFQYLASVAIVNSCQSYTYLVASETNFNLIPSSNFINGYKACLFTPGTTSLVQGIYGSDSISQFNNMVNYMNIVNNIGNFSTVSTQLYNQIANLTAYPQYATIIQTTNTSPMNEYNYLNNFANYSSSGSTQNCNQLKDFFVFSTNECGIYPLETGATNAGNNSCILLANSNSGTFSDRNALLSGCQNSTLYNSVALSLSNYAADFRTVTTGQLLPSNLFAQYPQAYYNYYLSLNQYLNPPFKAQVNSFVGPYNEFYNGLSCNYLNTTVTEIQTQVCNNFNPYLYFLSVINICLGSFCFAIMLLFYFLHPRLEFYSQMEGDLDKMIITAEISNDTNRIELVDTTQRRYV